jgi:hypothetical protein
MWQRKWNRPEEHDAQSPFMVQDGWVVRKPGSKQGTRNLAVQWHDCAIRTEMKWNHGGPNGSIQLRITGDLRYSLRRTSSFLELGFGSVKEDLAILKAYPVSEPKEGDTFSIELRAVGRTLTAKLDGREVIRVEDDHLSEGGVSIYIFPESAMRNIEVLNLDRPATTASKSSSVTATKDAPFVNTLGMKFVPVPITGGPTGGQRVLFSIWQTRVQDFEGIAKETKRQWRLEGFQEPTHPATMKWDDAQAFCAWLTERERKAGSLPAGEAYRLPSDHEWSCAVGIGDKEDPARSPMEKDGKLPGVFPWGTAWPPPAGAGNLGGEELQTVVPSHPKTFPDWLVGYRDPYPRTAPVGAFAPNALGLHDLGSNVREWCGDLFKPGGTERVLRGGAWLYRDKLTLASSYRCPYAPSSGSNVFGFRVVRAPAAP